MRRVKPTSELTLTVLVLPLDSSSAVPAAMAPRRFHEPDVFIFEPMHVVEG
jgi:hypothetical protein